MQPPLPQDVVAALRTHRELIVGRHGLQTTVVESWLAAVEAKCAEAMIDETGVRVCLRVVERWIRPIGELAEIHAALIRMLANGEAPAVLFSWPTSLKEWQRLGQ